MMMGKGTFSMKLYKKTFQFCGKKRHPNIVGVKNPQKKSINRKEFLSPRNGEDKHVVLNKIL